MSDQLKDSLDYLMSNGYLECVKGKYRATAKLNAAAPGTELVPVTSHANLPIVISTAEDWPVLFIHFIREAQVPHYCESTDGSQYECNKYSTNAMKTFRRMIEKEGVNYEVLVKSTMLYYKSGRTRLKKAIGNYIIEGLWRSDYLALMESAQAGAEQLSNHIQNTVHEPQKFTRDRLG